MTGDSLYFNFSAIQKTNILITTPEKFDSFTRKFKDHKKFIERIALLLLDEVHILNEDRGSTVEAIVSRFKMQLGFKSKTNNPKSSSENKATSQTTDPLGKNQTVKRNENNSIDNEYTISSSTLLPELRIHLRLVAVSATIPNLDDVAEWLQVSPEYAFRFNENERPIHLTKHVISFPGKKNAYMFDRFLDYKLFEVILKYSEGLQTLVFCPTRKSVSLSALQLSRDIPPGSNPFIKSSEQLQILSETASHLNDKTLAETVINGIGFHSAGLTFSDRKIVEELFLKDLLSVLCTTTTLAQGVNLPAHLVVIKSTQGYKNGAGFEEYSENSITQMMGRAGRPQFDTSGVVVIMTCDETRHLYEDASDDMKNKPMESHLKERMVEHINAEVVLRTITNVRDAVTWIKSTFFFIRLMKNPSFYGVPSTLLTKNTAKSSSMFSDEYTLSNTNAIEYVRTVVRYELNRLKVEGFITVSSDGVISSTENGISMSRYYIAFETVCLFKEILPTYDMKDILSLLSRSKEFQEIRIRLGEKKKLNDMNKHPNMRFPLKGKVKSLENKIYIIIQASIGRVPFEDFALKQESSNAMISLKRILFCLCDYLIVKSVFTPLRAALLLKKCVEQKMWDIPLSGKDNIENSYEEKSSKAASLKPTYVSVLEQLEGIGPVFASLLHTMHISTFEDVVRTPASVLEAILRRNPPFGEKLRKRAGAIPRYTLSISQSYTDDPKTVLITVGIDRIIDYEERGKATSSSRPFGSDINDSKLKYINRLTQKNYFEYDGVNDPLSSESNYDSMFMPSVQNDEDLSEDESKELSPTPSLSSNEYCILRLLVGNSKNELCFMQKIISRSIKGHYETSFTFEKTPRQQRLTIALINENYIGVDVEINYTVNFPLMVGMKKKDGYLDSEVNEDNAVGLDPTSLQDMKQSQRKNEALFKDKKKNFKDNGNKKIKREDSSVNYTSGMYSKISKKSLKETSQKDSDNLNYPKPYNSFPPSFTSPLTSEEKYDSNLFNSNHPYDQNNYSSGFLSSNPKNRGKLDIKNKDFNDSDYSSNQDFDNDQIQEKFPSEIDLEAPLSLNQDKRLLRINQDNLSSFVNTSQNSMKSESFITNIPTPLTVPDEDENEVEYAPDEFDLIEDKPSSVDFTVKPDSQDSKLISSTPIKKSPSQSYKNSSIFQNDYSTNPFRKPDLLPSSSPSRRPSFSSRPFTLSSALNMSKSSLLSHSSHLLKDMQTPTSSSFLSNQIPFDYNRPSKKMISKDKEQWNIINPSVLNYTEEE